MNLRIGLVVALLGLLVPKAGMAQSLDVVNVGSVSGGADTTLLIAQHHGFFKDVGITVNEIPFDAAQNMVAPLGTGQLDVGAGGPSAGFYNAFARGIAIKIVADRATNAPNYGHRPLVVRKELVTSGRFKTIADLKGLAFAEPSTGNTSLPLLQSELAKSGLVYDDVKHVYLGYATMLVAMQNGSVDAANLLEPFATQAAQMGIVTRIAGDDKFYPTQESAVILYSDAFIQKRPDVARRFMVAYIRAVRYYVNSLKGGHIAGTNSAEITAMLADALKMKDPAIFREMTATWVDPTGRVNEKSLTSDYESFKKLGLISGNVDVHQVIDNSFVDAANRTLGPYKAGNS